MTIPVAFAVGAVHLVLVDRRISHGEAVVGRDVVDRRDRAAVASAEQVDGTADPGCQLSDALARLVAGRAGDIGQPERAHSVTEVVVPLGERRWELAGAPAIRPEVPRLGDQLDP